MSIVFRSFCGSFFYKNYSAATYVFKKGKLIIIQPHLTHNYSNEIRHFFNCSHSSGGNYSKKNILIKLFLKVTWQWNNLARAGPIKKLSCESNKNGGVHAWILFVSSIVHHLKFSLTSRKRIAWWPRTTSVLLAPAGVTKFSQLTSRCEGSRSIQSTLA